MKAREIILRHTRIASPPLCPGIRLHLITADCPLWKADDADLARHGLDEPFWGFAWAGGQALARFILDRPELIRGKRVLDIGCGGGVEAIAAALAGASSVEAWDTDPLAITCLQMNAELNTLQVQGRCGDPLAQPCREDVQLILAGDMSYDQTVTCRLFKWLKNCTKSCSVPIQALVADPDRGFLPKDAPLTLLHSTKAPSDVDVGGKYLRDTRIYGLGWTALEREPNRDRMAP